MSNPEHARILMQGSRTWNAWRAAHPTVRPDLSRIRFHGINLSAALLSGVDLWRADLSSANLTGADLSNANLFRAGLSDANFDSADLRGADLGKATLGGCRLVRSQLQGAALLAADLEGAALRFANLAGADLSKAQLVKTNLTSANIVGCRVYGTSVWDVCLTNTIQTNLIITPEEEAIVEVDNLEVAQFVYLLLNNQRIRQVIDTITSKIVLILGRFTPDRKNVLDSLRQELRLLGYSPVLFDFDKPTNLNLTETITLLARMARFIIADITDPKSVPHELASIVPVLAVPVTPLLEGVLPDPPTAPYSMFRDLMIYPWVLRLHRYKSPKDLILSLKDSVIGPAEEKRRELLRIKNSSEQ